MNGPLLLAAGGTGGHIWPAISFGGWLERNVGIRPLHVAGCRPLEREIFEAAEVPYTSLQIEGSPLGAGGRKALHRWKGMACAFRETLDIVDREHPVGALLFGGYISAPVMAACLLRGVPIACHEQNAVAGKVTRLAAALHLPVFSGWNSCKPLCERRFRYTGIPVRSFRRLHLLEAWNKLAPGLPLPSGLRVVVLGGSLGSGFLCRSICDLASRSDLTDVTFLVIGAPPETKQPANVLFLPRQWDMAPVFSIADAAITRAGASTLAELLAYSVPALVVPWEGATNAHQLENANAFVGEGGGECCLERETSFRLMGLLQHVLGKAHKPKARASGHEEQASSLLWKEMVALVMKGDAPQCKDAHST